MDANIARTDYDQADRPCQTELRDSATGEALYKTGLKYNKLNQLEVFSEKAGSESHKSEYAYDRDNRVTSITYDGGSQKVNYTYDELGRVTTRTAECGMTAGKLTSTYEYVNGGYGTNSTTPLVKKITQNGVSFEYAYDTRGNIVSEKRGTLTTTYAYDALGQLIRVNDPHENATWVYNYDRGGNITSKVQYAYVTTSTLGTPVDTISYTYGDSNWKDKLTAYDDALLTYDAIGNLTNDGSWTYEWQAGHQLKRMNREGLSLTFKYDHNGRRIEKLLEHSWYPEVTKYIYYDNLLTHISVNYFDSDEIGTGCTVENGINTGRVAGNHTIIGDCGTDSTSRNDIFVLTFIWGMPRVPPLSFLLLTIEYTPKIVWLGMRTQDSVRAGRGCGKSSAPILPENVPLHSEDWFLSEPSAAVLQQRYVLPAEFHHMPIRPTPYLRQSRNWCMPLRLRQGSTVHANTSPAELLSCDYCCHLH